MASTDVWIKDWKVVKIYVGLSVLAYNLHILGNAIKEKKLAEEKRKEKRKLKLAA